MKKVLATILALVMALSLCITVWADLPVAGEGGIVTVDKDVTLSANYEVTANTTITVSEGATVHTNGHSIVVKNGATLTVNGNGTIACDVTDATGMTRENSLFKVEVGGKLIIAKGNFNTNGYALLDNKGEAEISSGTFGSLNKGNKNSGSAFYLSLIHI